MPSKNSKERIADFVRDLFPGQFLIPVASFAKLIGESYGGCRNRIAAGAFPLKVIQRGTRNYVAVFDVIDHLARLSDGKKITPPRPADPEAKEQEEKPTGRRRTKYGEQAKARAAAARAARAAKRETRATITVGGVA